MDFFPDRDGQRYCEDVPLAEVAQEYGTPTYVYSESALVSRFRAIDDAYRAVPHLVCYALKANSNLAVAGVLATLGAGADVVSGGELYRAIKAGIPAAKVLFAGVGKTRQEIAEALRAGILMFNVESAGELEAIAEVAESLGTRAPIALRVNPDVDPQTHPYISTGLKKSKFGVPSDQVIGLYRRAVELPHLNPIGVQMHIGSQLVKVQPIADAVAKVAGIVRDLKGIGVDLKYFDIGGGLGISYRDENPEGPRVLADQIVGTLNELGLTLLCEPGRFIVGNSGVLLTRVLYTKDNGAKKFVVVDAGMNDLIRPSLYDAYHEIVPVGGNGAGASDQTVVADVVGPVCESGDFFAHDRALPAVKPGQLLAIMSAGAYGFAMASNYNARPRPAEVLVKGRAARLARRRETYEDLIRGEEL